VAKQDRNAKTLLKEIGEIVLALAIAWFVYQGLGLLTGTNLPIVAVVSDSMYHGPNDRGGDLCGSPAGSPADFDSFWSACGAFYDGKDITKDDFRAFPMRSGLSKGDLLFVTSKEPEVGDIVIYQRSSQSYTIVHRIVEKGDTIVAKGDNNAGPDQPITRQEVEGTVAFAVPLLGYPRFALFAFGV